MESLQENRKEAVHVCILRFPKAFAHPVQRGSGLLLPPLACPVGLHREQQGPFLFSRCLEVKVPLEKHRWESRDAVQRGSPELASGFLAFLQSLSRVAASSGLPLQICSQINPALHSKPNLSPGEPKSECPTLSPSLSLPAPQSMAPPQSPSSHPDPHCFPLARDVPHLSQGFALAAHLC